MKLSPAMQRLVRALETYGNIDPIRDCGRGVGVSTIVALMDRGIIRESKRSHGIHMPATTPEQVWDEAHAENARREAEQAAYLVDNTNWVQCTPDGDRDTHTRQTRDGRTILIVEERIHYWLIYFGDDTQCSAGGTWQEVRRAADDSEREQAHDAALAEDDARSVAEGRKSLGWGQPDGMLGSAEVERLQRIAQSGVAHVRDNCPALPVGGCMNCTAPATVRAARGERVDSYERAWPWTPRVGDTVLIAGGGSSRVFGRIILIDGTNLKVQWPGGVDWRAAHELEHHPMTSDRKHRPQVTRDVVHAAHCCPVHGCKYGFENCGVLAGRVEADGSCERCAEDAPRLAALEALAYLRQRSALTTERDAQALATIEQALKEID